MRPLGRDFTADFVLKGGWRGLRRIVLLGVEDDFEEERADGGEDDVVARSSLIQSEDRLRR